MERDCYKYKMTSENKDTYGLIFFMRPYLLFKLHQVSELLQKENLGTFFKFSLLLIGYMPNQHPVLLLIKIILHTVFFYFNFKLVDWSKNSTPGKLSGTKQNFWCWVEIGRTRLIYTPTKSWKWPSILDDLLLCHISSN